MKKELTSHIFTNFATSYKTSNIDEYEKDKLLYIFAIGFLLADCIGEL